MKKLLYIIIFFFVFSSSVNAQSSLQIQLEKVTDALTTAMLHPEQRSLENLMSADLSYGHSAGLVQNKAEIIEGLINGPFRFLKIDISNQSTKIVDNIAMVRQVLSSDYSERDVSGKLKFGVLLVWHLEDGQWKLLARQATKL